MINKYIVRIELGRSSKLLVIILRGGIWNQANLLIVMLINRMLGF